MLDDDVARLLGGGDRMAEPAAHDRVLVRREQGGNVVLGPWPKKQARCRRRRRHPDCLIHTGGSSWPDAFAARLTALAHAL
jgi:hypothetical protein